MNKAGSLKSVWVWGILTLFGLFICFCLPSLTHAYFQKTEPFCVNPVSGQDNGVIIRNDSQGKGHFGASRDPNRLHLGLDITGSIGTKILATKSGRVIFSGVGRGYGNHIQILHPDGLESRYAHLSELHVKKGDWIHRGELIGHMGKTGNAGSKRMQTHVHFEIRKDNVPLDPLELIERRV